MNIEKKLDYLMKKSLVEENNNDTKVKRFKFNNSKLNSLGKKAKKKIEYVLVEYLTQNYQIKYFLSRLVSGNIIVMDNKPHEINPRYLFNDGKYRRYLIREIDMLPVSNTDYNKLTRTGRATTNAAVIIKAILGAVQKKEISQETRKWIIWILIAAGIGLVAWIFLGGK